MPKEVFATPSHKFVPAMNRFPDSQRKMPVLVGLTILGLLVAAGLLLRSWWMPFEESDPISPTRASFGPRVTASPSEERSRGLPGVIVARETVEVASRLEAILEEMMVALGDKVEQGDVVARLGSQDIEHELRGAKARHRILTGEEEASKLRASEARLHRSRVEALGDLASEEEKQSAIHDVQLADTERAIARAKLEEQDARIAQIESRLANALVRAPFAGQVAARYVDAGALVRPGTVLVRLIRGEDKHVRFAVDPATIGALKQGDPVEVCAPDLGIRLPAIIHHCSPEMDLASGMLHMEAILQPAEGYSQLRIGMQVEVMN